MNVSNSESKLSTRVDSPDSDGSKKGEYEGDESGNASQEHSLHVGESYNKGSNPLFSESLAENTK